MLRVAGRRLSSLSWRSAHTSSSSAFIARNPINGSDSPSSDRYGSIPRNFSVSSVFMDQNRGHSFLLFFVPLKSRGFGFRVPIHLICNRCMY
ncbi:hypothetical protein Acr_29g0001560 [Actinidia rufa]|uniref:Uncharacterized protein n=1 Tax=Actinidia rufa TaxID=165716 RepID=A0A7J0HE53_9ERIC|nr:hypothetical protein Acr_29g0001560 [Actinidia rufa]